ncbi:MAG: 4Fe-4S binding protein [Campylobacterales bacterium]
MTHPLQFDRLLCLRTDYAYHECNACETICPEGAFKVVRNRIELSKDACISCGGCVGGCPTQALGLMGIEPESIILRKVAAQSSRLSCREEGWCLALLSVEHWIALGLKVSAPISCDLSECHGCELDKAGHLQTAIISRLGEAEEFVTKAGLTWPITITRHQAEPSRRTLFRRLKEEAKELATTLPTLSPEHAKGQTLPLSRTLLKKSLQERAEEINETIAMRTSFIAAKLIDPARCTNCRDCVNFCPAGALFYDGTGTQIHFQIGKCIHCAICNAVCKEHAISEEDEIDLVALAFDRAKMLVAHRLETCSVCRTPFSQRGEETICPRCVSFHTEFPDMFKTAEELGL